MNNPSTRTRHAMEIAADLRARGATWATIVLKLKRQPGLRGLARLEDSARGLGPYFPLQVGIGVRAARLTRLV
jgi:hypothetical protein